MEIKVGEVYHHPEQDFLIVITGVQEYGHPIFYYAKSSFTSGWAFNSYIDEFIYVGEL